MVKAIKSNSNLRVTVQNGIARAIPKAKDAPLSKSISSGQSYGMHLDGIDISICANVSFLFIQKISIRGQNFAPAGVHVST